VSTNLILAPEAEQDLDDAYQWYEDRRRGLGHDFLERVDASLQLIRRWPEAQAIVWEGYRRALVRRFPCAIFYEVTGSDVIVYGVMHTARDEQKWRDRLT